MYVRKTAQDRAYSFKDKLINSGAREDAGKRIFDPRARFGKPAA
jgi:hypothetical protein